jgi:hypothetical protein
MKTYTIIIAFLMIGFVANSQTFKGQQAVTALDSVTMGPSYANDIYYSFENGVVASPARNTWDIGFRTTVWTASIITNGGSGVNLYTYPNADTTGWNSVDTAGMAGWTVLYDDENDYEYGAFNRNSGSGHPDYGWGKYNPISHDVVGDSIYILKNVAGNYYKIWILRKNSIGNTYYLRFAQLDGSGQQDITLEIHPYRAKNFVYFNFDNSELIDREPDTATWDVLFTKYMAIQPNGTPYPVIGIYNNTKVYSNQFIGVGPDFIDWTSAPMDSTKSPIGWEWKYFDMNSFTWTVADTNAFFVQAWDKDVYKLVFKKFTGTGSGKVVFETSLQSPSSVIEPGKNISSVSVYPNPVTDHLTVNFSNEVSGNANIMVYDMSGKMIFQDDQPVLNNSVNIRLHEAGLQNGLYVLKITTGDEIFSSKFMISKF